MTLRRKSCSRKSIGARRIFISASPVTRVLPSARSPVSIVDSPLAGDNSVRWQAVRCSTCSRRSRLVNPDLRVTSTRRWNTCSPTRVGRYMCDTELLGAPFGRNRCISQGRIAEATTRRYGAAARPIGDDNAPKGALLFHRRPRHLGAEEATETLGSTIVHDAGGARRHAQLKPH